MRKLMMVLRVALSALTVHRSDHFDYVGHRDRRGGGDLTGSRG